jgi:hypothetical protein
MIKQRFKPGDNAYHKADFFSVALVHAVGVLTDVNGYEEEILIVSYPKLGSIMEAASNYNTREEIPQ